LEGLDALFGGAKTPKKPVATGLVYDTAVLHRGLTCKLLRLLPDRHMIRMIMELVGNRGDLKKLAQTTISHCIDFLVPLSVTREYQPKVLQRFELLQCIVVY